ncbi:glycosyltransferase [Salinibaculum marinum]|uniref:glycosyltransferase family 4 protein n=1 Tax=Salinibaculum marinum TaxID=3131993 RepID=UPI0030CEE603
MVTQPARRESGKTHAHQLLDILAASTSVVLLTANLASDAPVRKDHDVVELTSRGTGDSLLVTAYRFLWHQLLMASTIRRREEQVVLFFGATAYILPILVAKTTGKTVIVEPRGDVPLSLRLTWEKQIPRPLARALAGLVSLLEHSGYIVADAIVAYTPSMADELGLNRYAHKLHTDGARYVDVDHFQPEGPFEARPLTVGYLGRLDVEKGIPTLVDVVKRLPEEIGFRFVGDGDYREVVERELADELESGRVELTGWVDHDEVPAELNQMRLLLLTSEPTEGLPTAILESFACGTPVYATSVSGIPDVVRDSDTGFLMDELDSAVVAGTVAQAVETGTLAEMSERCREMAETGFNFEAAVKRYREILASVV